MKKKALLTIAIVAIFVCLFAISISAENNIIKLEECPTLEEINANPSAYVSHLNAFDESSLYKSDPDSVVVLCDQQETKAWYVFPAAYVISSSSYTVNYDNLNTAIAAVDEAAFALYSKNTGGRGGSTYMIRIEVPTYVTYFGYDKFENCPELLEVYFPTKLVTDEETGETKEVTYFKEFTQADFFGGGTAKLQKVHNVDKVPTTSLTNAFFSGCTSLEYVKLPAGLTSIVGNCFSNCKSLPSIEIPEGVTSIGRYAFNNCSSLTEVVLPNGVTSIGKAAFNGCTSLESFTFSANFNTLSRENADYETFYKCDGLKYVYMPTGFLAAISGASAGDYKHIFNDIDSKVTFFFTGTEAEANEIVRLMALTNNNPTLGNAKVEAYDENTDYTDYGTKKGSNVIVYGYYACDAFYNGEHINAVTYGFDGEDKYTSNFCMYDGCTRCTNRQTTSYGTLFTNKGYSKEDGSASFTYGIVFNTETIALYEEKMTASFDYGFVVGSVPDETDGKIVNADGTTNLQNFVIADCFDTSYSIYTIKLVGINTDEYKALEVFCCAYIIDNGTVKYAGEAISDTATPICYNDVKAVATAPSTDDKTQA